ncbi:MAG: FtsW/RodA/SpoVE family cell cycle protein [Alphaproteobacteria bacterium]|nr:FtsW/RodA/SpoVE family cell cycle protein [Alphaproteobacteria bacterium]
MTSRSDTSPFARWWSSLDRVSFLCIVALLTIGIFLAFAASPAATGHRNAAGNFSYALKQLAFALMAVAILLSTTLLDLKQTRIVAACVYALAVIGALLALVAGADVNGAHRWLDFAGFKLQPSEFLKPGFTILAAMFMADKLKHGFAGEVWTAIFLAPALAILLLQPDIGQTALLSALCVAMLFFAGISRLAMAGLAAGGSAVFGLAWLVHPHVRERFAEFFNSGGYQTGLALKAFRAGGITGVGPGAGTIKYRLPDAHTDFVYAVAGEEFGVFLCGVIAILFGVLTVRLLLRSARARDPFVQLAGAGLAAVTGMQAFINMGVSLSILPAKGMTLPFISYGGSSLFAIALTMGFALGLTRNRPVWPEELVL